MAVQIDQLDGVDWSDSKEGLEGTRMAKVTECTGTGIQKIGQALSQLDGDGYTTESALVFSDLGVIVYLKTRRITAIDTDTVEVALNYRTRTFSLATDVNLPQYEGSVRLVQKNTAKNRDGSQITVTHQGETVGATASVFVPQTTVNISRIEAGVQPLNVANQLIGKLNKDVWNGPVNVWLSTAVSFRSQDAGQTWEMGYEFQKDADGEWQPTVVFRDADGRIPGNLVAGQGIKTIEWYEETNFGQILEAGA